MKRISARNKQYWINKGESEENATRLARSRMPGTPEYFLLYKKTAISNEDAIKLSNEWNKGKSLTLENFIKKYGEVIGEEKFNQYREKQAYSNTVEYFIKKYGTDAGVKKYKNANKKRAITLNNLIEKHGEFIGTEMYNSYVNKQRVNGKKLEYFIEKYGESDGKRTYEKLNYKKSRPFESYLEKHKGNFDAASKEYETIQQKMYEANIKSRGVSKSSQHFFDELYERLKTHNIFDVYYASNIQEFGINIIGKRYVFLDFFVKSKGKVIEYNGDYYHANPLKFKSGDIIKCYGEEKLVDDVWKREQNRLADIKTVPYIKDILVIWESEALNNPEETLNKCVNFIIT